MQIARGILTKASTRYCAKHTPACAVNLPATPLFCRNPLFYSNLDVLRPRHARYFTVFVFKIGRLR